MMTLLEARSDRSRAMDWIQIGAMAGPTIELPSVALRAANLRIQGIGQGAVSTETYLAELPRLVGEIESGAIAVNVRQVSLSDVESAWRSPTAPANGPSSYHRPLGGDPPVGDRAATRGWWCGRRGECLSLR